MLIYLKVERSGVKYFRFQRMWGSHEEFLPLVRECWNQRVEDCAMVRVSKKLKRMKQVLRR